jgi:hypothetical protein
MKKARHRLTFHAPWIMLALMHYGAERAPAA